MLCDLVESEMAVCLPASLLLRLALWVSIVASFLGLLCEVDVDVVAAKLMASSRDVAAWNSSFDIDSWRELPQCLGETSSSCMSMS